MYIRKAVCILFILGFISTQIFAQDPEWSLDLDQKAGWSQITSAGTLLVGSKSQIQHIDTESGELLWSIETNTELAPFNIHDMAGSGYLLIAEQFQNVPPKTRIRAYELMTGDLLWETEDMMASNLALIPDLARDQVLYIGSFVATKKGLPDGTIMRAYKLTTGEIAFESQLGKHNIYQVHRTDTAGWFATAMDLSGHSSPVIEEDKIYLPYGGLTSLDLVTGEVLWENKFKTVDTGLKNTNSGLLIEGDLIYGTGKGSVYAINKNSGETVWSTKLGGKYALPEIQVLDDQIVVRVGGLFSDGQNIQPRKPFGVASLDKESGSKRWLWKSAKNSITNMQILPDISQVVVADKKNLYRLNLAAEAKAEVLEKRNLEFKRKMGATDTAVKAGKIGAGLLSGGLVGGLQGGLSASKNDNRSDPPSHISLLGDDIVIRGNYHILSHNPATQEDNWSIAFAPPGVSGMMLALSGAAMAFTSLGNAGMHSSMSIRDRKVDNALSSADGLGNIMTRRYAAAEQAGSLGFFLTKADKDSGHKLQLMGIDLTTGEEAGAVPIEEKEPVFKVDNIGRKVFYFHKDKQIRAFAF